MGLIDDKKNVFTTIGAYTSLAEDIKGTVHDVVALAGEANEYANIGRNVVDETTNIYTSINNNEDTGAFLKDILGVVVGTTGLKELIGELFTNFTENLEGTLKEIISKQLTSANSGNDLTDYPFFVDGLEVSAPDIDVYGLFRNDPASEAGSMLFDTNAPNFNNFAYDAIVTESWVNYQDVLNINYNATTDSFVFKPFSSTGTVGEWVNNYIEKAPMINKKEFISNIMDRIYGVITTNGDKTTEMLFNELQIDKLLEQVLSGNDSFIISEDDYAELMSKAEQLKNGVVYYDMGCGVVDAELPLSAMTAFVDFVSGSTDPFLVAEAADATVSESYTEADNEDVGDENAETIRNGFFSRLIDFLKLELSKLLTTSPQARMLLAITSSFSNEGIPQINDPREDLKSFKTYIKCTIDEALAALYEFMFYLIVGLLVALLVPIIRAIIAEKINQYIGVIKSLISSQI